MDRISLQMGFSGNPSAFAMRGVGSVRKTEVAQATTGVGAVAKSTANAPTAEAEYNRRFDRFEKTGKAASGNGVEGECQTCANRKYQDGSDDPGVSFQTPTKVSSGAAVSAVRAHEQEHVTRNAAKADREGKTAHSTVAIHTAICPECGKSYVSGGTTTTTYSPKRQNDSFELTGTSGGAKFASGVASGSSGNPALLKKFGAGTSLYAA
jgi:hypothetical protein